MRRQISSEENNESISRPLKSVQSQEPLSFKFRGLIETGLMVQQQSLCIMYTITHGQSWRIISGCRSGISQLASSNGQEIVWNFPFEVICQTKLLVGWPQLILVLYGNDMLGRSQTKGYGNTHLPSSEGYNKKQIKMFETLPTSKLSQLCSFFTGSKVELKNPEIVLGSTEGRQFIRTQSVGQIKIKCHTYRYNFSQLGYQ